MSTARERVEIGRWIRRGRPGDWPGDRICEADCVGKQGHRKTKNPDGHAAGLGGLAECFTWPQVAVNRHELSCSVRNVTVAAGNATPRGGLRRAAGHMCCHTFGHTFGHTFWIHIGDAQTDAHLVIGNDAHPVRSGTAVVRQAHGRGRAPGAVARRPWIVANRRSGRLMQGGAAWCQTIVDSGGRGEGAGPRGMTSSR